MGVAGADVGVWAGLGCAVGSSAGSSDGTGASAAGTVGAGGGTGSATGGVAWRWAASSGMTVCSGTASVRSIFCWDIIRKNEVPLYEHVPQLSLGSSCGWLTVPGFLPVVFHSVSSKQRLSLMVSRSASSSAAINWNPPAFDFNDVVSGGVVGVELSYPVEPVIKEEPLFLLNVLGSNNIVVTCSGSYSLESAGIPSAEEEVARNGLPRMIGACSSASQSKIKKSAGNMNLSTRTRMSSIFPSGCTYERSANCSITVVGLASQCQASGRQIWALD
ncbi:hypothetical protein V6N11_018682 [Hibiscus sabdariffa]|uniref:Uncharacterized protein n=1 Tax=Hibiscus sabdariffa TaxID=183260 RepID=A0ABR2QTB7_9ROSI